MKFSSLAKMAQWPSRSGRHRIEAPINLVSFYQFKETDRGAGAFGSGFPSSGSLTRAADASVAASSSASLRKSEMSTAPLHGAAAGANAGQSRAEPGAASTTGGRPNRRTINGGADTTIFITSSTPGHTFCTAPGRPRRGDARHVRWDRACGRTRRCAGRSEVGQRQWQIEARLERRRLAVWPREPRAGRRNANQAKFA